MVGNERRAWRSKAPGQEQWEELASTPKATFSSCSACEMACQAVVR